MLVAHVELSDDLRTTVWLPLACPHSSTKGYNMACSTWSQTNTQPSIYGHGGQEKRYGRGSIRLCAHTLTLTTNIVTQEVQRPPHQLGRVDRDLAVQLRKTLHPRLHLRNHPRSDQPRRSNMNRDPTSWTCAPGFVKHREFRTENRILSSKSSPRFGSGLLAHHRPWSTMKKELLQAQS